MLMKVPKDLPWFGASTFGLALMAYGFVGMYVESAAGRPSSTSALGCLFIPIWGLFAGLVGLALGFLARAIVRRMRPSGAPDRHTWLLLIALAGVVLLSAAAGGVAVRRYEARAKPGLRIDSGMFEREFRSDHESTARTARLLHDFEKEMESIPWGKNHSSVQLTKDGVRIVDTRGGRHAEFSMVGLDYLTRVDAANFLRSPEAPPWLAIVITGRATGRRSILAVVDENYQIVYEEMLERFWPSNHSVMEVRRSEGTGLECIVVGPDCNESIILRTKLRVARPRGPS